MSIKDYFKNAFSMIFRDKKKIFYIIIMIICTILATCSLAFNYNYKNYVATSINKNIGFRTLMVSPKEDLNDLGKAELFNINHVVDVYDSSYNSKALYSNLKNTNLDGYVELIYGSMKALPNVVSGRTFGEEERNVAICPVKFYPDISAYKLKIKEQNIIDGHDLLSKTFTVKYNALKFNDSRTNIIDGNEFTKTFEVVGLYNNTQIMTLNNQCFVSASDLIEIIDIENAEIKNESSFSYFTIIVDEVNNLEDTIKEIENLGFLRVQLKNTIDTNLVNIIQMSCNIILFLVLFSVIMITSSYIKKKFISEIKTIGILRTCGYNKKIVRNIYFLETIFTNIISYIKGLIVFLIIYLILKKAVFGAFSYIGLKTSIDIFSLLVSFTIIVIIPLIISIYQVSKKSRLNIVQLVGSEE